jgi:hypothetical protein
VVDRVADQAAVGATNNAQCSADDGDPGVTCTLRAAVQEANGTGGADVIQLPNLGAQYALTLAGDEDLAASGDLDVRQSLTIQGGAGIAPTIAGSGADRVFHVGPAGAAGLSMANVRIVGGGGVSTGGGAMVENGSIGLTNVTFEQNLANVGAATEGGGLWIGNGGSHAITASTFEANKAVGTTSALGGGIRVGSGAAVAIVNSTISGNFADGGPTGTGAGGGIHSQGSTTLTHATLHENQAAGLTPLGGGVFSAAGGISFRASILSDGFGAPGARNCEASSGLLLTAGFNLEALPGGAAFECNFLTAAGDRFSSDAGTAPLADRGGATETHALLNGSPALDVLPSCAPTTTDQRGQSRPGAFACDVGSFERQVAIDPSDKCFGRVPTIIGFSENEKIVGTPDDDVIVSGGGDDKVKGGDGDDRICGAKGKDLLRGGPGNDRIDGGDKKDELYGQAGKDRLKGGGGSDLLKGGKGRDILEGGSGRDNCRGAGRDKLRKC